MTMNPIGLPLFAAVSLIAIAVTGCQEPPPPEPQLLAETPALHVVKRTETHIVRLDNHGAPGDIEKLRLKGFIADLAGKRPDSIHVVIKGAPPATAAGIAKLLAADGVDPVKIAVGAAPIAPGKVTIEVERYDVAALECPSWSTGPVATNDNSTNANFGCTNLSNLAAMVADPHDLIAGSSSLKGDGTTAAAAVRAYHDDKTKPLPNHNAIFSMTGPNNASTGESGSAQ